jgi:TonB-linked SusC/RagA family outer membrane protein
LKVGENLSSSYINNSLINAGNALNLAIQEQPIVPIYTVNGGWGGPSSGMTDRENPLEVIELNKQNVDNTVRVFGNVYADLEIIPHLHFKTSFGIDYSGEYDRVLQKSYVSGFMSDPNNMLTSNFDFQGSYTWQNTLNYDLKVNKNTFNMLLGEEQNLYNSQTFWGSREGYLLENLDYAYLNSGTSNINNGGSGTSNALLSYFAKINYSYDNKYLASVTLRRDGSSRFGLNNQFGYFPAFSLGWRLSDEKFLSNIKELSDLKLRFGWGSSGNQDIANNGTYTLYQAVYGTDPTWSADQGTAYAISGQGSGQLPSGFVLVQQGNKDLKWETTKESNFGMDFGFLHNNLTGSIDYFIRETSNILIEPGYLAAIGEGGGEWLNGASMQNKGFEAILSYSKKLSKDLSLTVSGNISSYRNMVTKLPEDVLTAYPGNGTTITILGHSINSIYGYVADGLFQSQAEVDNSPIQPGKGVGRIRYKDLNGDGSVDANDQTFISSGDPDFTYGLNIALVYKQFDFNMFLQGVQGLKEINNYKIYTDFSSIWPGTNWGSRTLDAWSPQNTSSTIPALTLTDNNNEGRTSTYLLENGSYLKVRNMQLGYNFRNVSKLISNARIYLQGSNLLTFKAKSYTAPDPENPSYAYPIPLILTIGVNITL